MSKSLLRRHNCSKVFSAVSLQQMKSNWPLLNPSILPTTTMSHPSCQQNNQPVGLCFVLCAIDVLFAEDSSWCGLSLKSQTQILMGKQG